MVPTPQPRKGARIFAPDYTMLKVVTFQPLGVDGFSAWEPGSDEGGAENAQTAPNPLSDLTAGIAANLYMSLQQAAEALDLSIDDMKVEVKVDVSWQAPFARDWAGFRPGHWPQRNPYRAGSGRHRHLPEGRRDRQLRG